MDDRSIEMANTLGTAREEVVVQFILDFLAGKSAPVAMDRREPMVSIGG